MREEAPSLDRIRDALPYIVYVFDFATGSTSYVNRHIAAELGYSDEAIVAMGPGFLAQLLHPEDLARLPELLGRWRTVADGEALETEYRLRHADGSYRWFYGRDVVLARDAAGVVIQLLGTTIDITARKSLESRLQISQKLEALGRLAGGIAHDFNNIITAIVGNADLARSQLDDPAWVEDCLDQIRGAAEQAASLTRSLLGFARQQVVRPEVVEVNRLVVEVQRLLRRVLGDDIELLLELGADAGAVRIDPGQLTQIVLNLAVNARDAMPSGGDLTIRTASVVLDDAATRGLPELVDGDYVILEVRDSGVGMSPDVVARVFEPFFTTKGDERGSGLGLATVYGIVRQAGGAISVDSAPGAGSTFTIHLPRIAGSSPLGVGPSAGGRRPGGRGVVLLVEDAAPVAAVVRESLERAGYAVTVARSGRQALQVLRDLDALDLLITDLILPGASGIEVAREAVARWPAARVLVISGRAADSDEGEIRRIGGEFLAKPFASEALLDRVAALLDREGGAASSG